MLNVFKFFVLVIVLCLWIQVFSLTYEVTKFSDNSLNSTSECIFENNCSLRSAWSACKNSSISCELCTIVLPSYVSIDFNRSFGPLYLSTGDNIEITGGTESWIVASEYFMDEYFASFLYYLHDSTVDNNCPTSLTISGVSISNFGSESASGGALYFNGEGNLSMNHVTFTNNQARSGGAVYISSNNDGAYINNCNFLNNSADSLGGAIFITTSQNISISNSVIADNIAYKGGGVNIYNNNYNIRIENSLIERCHADNVGGGIALNENNDNFVLFNSTISYCSSGTKGGGMYSKTLNDYTRIVGSSILYCEAGDRGGGVYIDTANTNAVIQDSYIAYCYAVRFAGGVGLAYENDDLMVLNTTISQCHAEYYGGGMLLIAENHRVQVLYSTIDHCSAVTGGGISLYSSNNDFLVLNSTISHCTSDYQGGGISLSEDNNDFHVYHSTITNCTAAEQGGGIYLELWNDYTQIIGTSIVYCQTDYRGGGMYIDTNNTNALIQDSYIAHCYGAEYAGGVGLKDENHDLWIVNTTISHCHSDAFAGGLLLTDRNQRVHLLHSTIEHCTAAGAGGGIVVAFNNRHFTISYSSIVNCHSWEDPGGAIVLDTGNKYFTLSHSEIVGCSTPSLGGGIAADSGNNHMLITNSTIRDCYTVEQGGGIYSTSNNDMQIEYSTIHNCSTLEQGGGVYLYWEHHRIKFTQVTWTGNTAGQGGAIFSNTMSNQLVIAGNTFLQNTASSAERGGGAIVLEGKNPQFVVTDTTTAEHLQVLESPHPYENPTAIVPEGLDAVFYNYTVSDPEALGFILQFDPQCDIGGNDKLLVLDEAGDPLLTLRTDSAWPGYQAPALRVSGSSFTLQLWGFISDLYAPTKLSDNKYGYKLYVTPILSQPGKPTVFQENAALYGNGGAINLAFSIAVPNIINAVFTNNTAMSGGALFIGTTSAAVSIENVIFQHNTAATHGGAMYVGASNGGLRVTNCNFLSNTALGNGGAVTVGLSNGHMKIVLMENLIFRFINTDFYHNKAMLGGALFIDRDNRVAMERCRLFGNHAGVAGGAINLAQENTLKLSDSLLEENSAVEMGGAVMSTIDNTLYLKKLAFTRNFAGIVGGALCLQSDTVVHMEGNMSFTENSAEQVGGAISLVNSPLWTLYGGTASLVGNSARQGSAVAFSRVGEGSLHDLYFANNTASVGGTVFWVKDAVMQVEPAGLNTSCIVWDSNTALQYGPQVATQAITVLGPDVYDVHAYGTALSPAPVFTLRDYYQQDMPIEGPSAMQAVLVSTNRSQCAGFTPALSGELTVVMNASATFDAVEVECAPEGSIQVRVEALLLDLIAASGDACNVDLSVYTITHTMRLDFRACYRGEIMKNGRCVQCPLNSYSLEYPVTEETECGECSNRKGIVSCYGDVLEVSAGYWRRHETSHAVLDCLEDVNGCQGGNKTGNALCEEGYEGPLCAVCSDGYYSSSGMCEMCGEEGVVLSPTVITFMFIAAGLVVVLLFFFYAKCVDETHSVEKEAHLIAPPSGLYGMFFRARQRVRKVVHELSAQIKIMITTYQIVSSIPSNMSVEFPAFFMSFLKVFSVFNLNVVSVVPFSCQQSFTYIDKLVFSTLFPIGLTGLLIVLCMLDGAWQLRHHSWTYRSPETNKKLENLSDQYLTYFFFLTYLVLPSVSTTIFQTFLCTNVDPRHEDSDPSDSYLIADMSISCTSDYYQRGVIYAVLMLFVYVVGIPTMYFVVLYRNRKELKERDHVCLVQDACTQTEDDWQTKAPESVDEDSVKPAELSSAAARLSFLWEAYEPQYWYWEVVETTRRLMLTAVLSVCGPGTSVQSIFAVLLALVCIKLYGYYCPYVSGKDDVVAEVGQFQIFFSFLGALIYQKSLLGEEWSVAVSVTLIVVNACVGVLFAYYAALDLTVQIDEYKEQHKTISREESRRAAVLEMKKKEGEELRWIFVEP